LRSLTGSLEGDDVESLGNSKAVADKYYPKPTEVLRDVRKAVNDAMRGLTA
jgi:hypothetical protein